MPTAPHSRLSIFFTLFRLSLDSSYLICLFQYFSLVIFLFVVEFLFATLAFVFRENLGGTLKEELTEGIKVHYNATGSNSLENIWNHIHKEVLLESLICVTIVHGTYSKDFAKEGKEPSDAENIIVTLMHTWHMGSR